MESMQAVVLAAGVGKRMHPLTLSRPKPLIEVAGTPLIEHIIQALPAVIDEIILIVGYRGEMIRDHLGSVYGRQAIRYIHQDVLAGTSDALALARPHLARGSFLVMCADDIHGPDALVEAVRHPLSILAARHAEPSRFGVLEMNSDGMLCSIEEKPAAPKSDLVSTGAMVLDERVFEHEASEHESGERYLTDQVCSLARQAPITIIEQPFWIALGYPEDIERAEAELRRGRIAPNAV
jgi:UDP-N-acetylglucosamine diphosphorylase / glucose-1-phosphate thymidylyltransferase / UDP-N-acetylgalactosamine diphosphorylase / glucosamine-1-phosphate N-acetyltransferase / galactosamine-1-phosphate N-acetyltransferase